MPYKKKIARKSKSVISENLRTYLLTGERKKGDAEVFRLSGSRERLRKVWDAVKDEIVSAWIKQNPGTRPWPWWSYDAPKRDTGTGAWFEPLPVSRRRISGRGQTTCDKYPAVVPTFDKGIPFFCEIDESDPPCYESEATYLERYGFLTETEKVYLKKHPELLEPERVGFEEDEKN